MGIFLLVVVLINIWVFVVVVVSGFLISIGML